MEDGIKKEMAIEQGKRRESGKEDRVEEGGRGKGRKECNVTADKVSIAASLRRR